MQSAISTDRGAFFTRRHRHLLIIGRRPPRRAHAPAPQHYLDKTNAVKVPDKLGATVDELQEPLAGLSPCAKSSFGCMGDANIRGRIEDSGRKQVLLCGIETHVCVWQTAAALLRDDYSVHLICDATSSRSVFNRDVGFRRMERAGVHMSCVEMVLFELMVDAAHPKFRDVTRLLK